MPVVTITHVVYMYMYLARSAVSVRKYNNKCTCSCDYILDVILPFSLCSSGLLCSSQCPSWGCLSVVYPNVMSCDDSWQPVSMQLNPVHFNYRFFIALLILRLIKRKRLKCMLSNTLTQWWVIFRSKSRMSRYFHQNLVWSWSVVYDAISLLCATICLHTWTLLWIILRVCLYS